MIKGVNFIGFTTSNENTHTFQAYNPESNSPLPEKFYTATESEVARATQKAADAFNEYKNVSGASKAEFIDKIASEILALGDELIHRAMAESGLPAKRLEGERGRTISQLKMFAELLREGSWVDARIDKGDTDLRFMSYPIGPVAVFGASNFPLAFSTAGGDTASALAAGCPVVIKSHESHPGTHELVAGAILAAAKETGMPDGVFSSLNGGADTGTLLIRDPRIKAVGFTGSFRAGKSIFDLANQRPEPIPVYAEMGSTNPVFLLDGKLSNEASDIAAQYAQSVTLGAGQFCTNPGHIIGVQGDNFDQFKKSLVEELQKIPATCMLNKGISTNYRNKRSDILLRKGITPLLNPENDESNLGGASVAEVNASTFLTDRAIHEEVFGPFTLLVTCKDKSEMHEVAKSLEGQLTITFIGNDDELTDSKSLVDICREKAGRIIFNGVPTGVAVTHAMQHGGPFPATTNAKYTSVGSTAIQRFVHPVTFQDCPESLLPDELKDENPLHIFRLVDGSYTR